jgi:hypothetical protein
MYNHYIKSIVKRMKFYCYSKLQFELSFSKEDNQIFLWPLGVLHQVQHTHPLDDRIKTCSRL